MLYKHALDWIFKEDNIDSVLPQCVTLLDQI